ncbi:MAG: tyrosine-type recombinase/integrase, partial [Acidimicrobiales bacterium]
MDDQQDPEMTSGNTGPDRRLSTPLLTGRYATALSEYVTALARSPLGTSTRDKYRRNVRGYLGWIELGEVDGDPLDVAADRDGAVRDYRAHLKTTPGRRGNRRRSPATINNVLAALDDFHTRRGLGRAVVRRENVVRRRAPRSLDDRQSRRYLRAAEQRERAKAATSGLGRARGIRDRLLAELPYQAGLRASEVAALDLTDVRMSARKGRLVVNGKGDKVRT